MLNDLDYIGIGIGLTAMSVMLGAVPYGLSSVKFGAFDGTSASGKIAGATLLLSSLALGATTSAIGSVTGDLPFKEFVGLSIASGVMAYALGWMSTRWSTLVKNTDQIEGKLHRD